LSDWYRDLMKLSLLHKRNHDASKGADIGEAETVREYSLETHFEQLTFPTGKELLPTSFRSLLGLEPRKR
jgi:hypothetical protein